MLFLSYQIYHLTYDTGSLNLRQIFILFLISKVDGFELTHSTDISNQIGKLRNVSEKQLSKQKITQNKRITTFIISVLIRDVRLNIRDKVLNHMCPESCVYMALRLISLQFNDTINLKFPGLEF